jgi:hypothetical protein
VRIKATNTDSSCDDSGVTGIPTDISNVAVKFTAKLPNGTCADLTGTPQFEHGRVKVKWQRVSPSGRLSTVAVSKALLATASFDSGSNALILATQPIAKGGFVGATMTLHLGIDADAATFNETCTHAQSVGLSFGQTNSSSIDAQ